MSIGINHLKKDVKLAKVIDRLSLSGLIEHENYFMSLVRAIIGQQLSVKAADTIEKRFLALFPKGAPAPKQIIKTDTEKLRSCGLSYSKVAYIKDLSAKVLDGTLDFENIDKLSDKEVIEHLIQVKGIGQWSAEMFLIFTLHRPDIFSYGDLGLKNAIKNIYNLRKHPSPRKAKEITDKWKPHRSLASRYLWASLDNKPKPKKD